MFASRGIRLLSFLMGILVAHAGTAFAHARGNHAGDWSPGQEIRVCVCPPPGGADFSTEIQAALDVWNNSKDYLAGVRGVRMTYHMSLVDCSSVPPTCDVTLDWSPGNAWGTTGAGTNPIPVNVEPNDGLTGRGVQRVLMHELGHVKGLGHSGLSTIMKWNYRGSGNNPPGVADLNSADAFETPNNDDKALNKELHGGLAATSGASLNGNTQDLGGQWGYQFQLVGLAGPGFVDPVTRFTVELPPQVNGLTDLNVVQMPPGWNSEFIPGEPPSVEGKKLDNEEKLQRSLLTFWTDAPASGIPPGGIGQFGFVSTWAPGEQRAYTNSPNADTDEFLVGAPADPPVTPTTTPWAMSLLGLGLLVTALVGFRRVRIA